MSVYPRSSCVLLPSSFGEEHPEVSLQVEAMRLLKSLASCDMVWRKRARADAARKQEAAEAADVDDEDEGDVEEDEGHAVDVSLAGQGATLHVVRHAAFFLGMIGGTEAAMLESTVKDDVLLLALHIATKLVAAADGSVREKILQALGYEAPEHLRYRKGPVKANGQFSLVCWAYWKERTDRMGTFPQLAIPAALYRCSMLFAGTVARSLPASHWRQIWSPNVLFWMGRCASSSACWILPWLIPTRHRQMT